MNKMKKRELKVEFHCEDLNDRFPNSTLNWLSHEFVQYLLVIRVKKNIFHKLSHNRILLLVVHKVYPIMWLQSKKVT